MRRPATGRVIVAAATATLCLSACGSGGAAKSESPEVSFTPPATTASARSAPTTSTPAPRSTGRRPAPSRTRSSSRPATHTSAPHVTVPKGTVVVLNPGHNGGNASHPSQINRQVPAGYGAHKDCDTTGTESNAGYPEHAFTWDVSLRVRAILRAHGVRVVLTRPGDNGVGPCVDERTAIGNHPNVAAAVSIHADGAASSGHGFHVNQDSRTPDGATPAIARRSDRLGEAIHATLSASSGLVPSTYIGRNGYYYRTDLAGLDLATRPATFLELGNMRNGGDAALQSSSSGRERIAKAVAAGILDFLGR